MLTSSAAFLSAFRHSTVLLRPEHVLATVLCRQPPSASGDLAFAHLRKLMLLMPPIAIFLIVEVARTDGLDL